MRCRTSSLQAISNQEDRYGTEPANYDAYAVVVVAVTVIVFFPTVIVSVAVFSVEVKESILVCVSVTVDAGWVVVTVLGLCAAR